MPFMPSYRDEEPSREEIDRSEGLLVLEFGANWCSYCQALSPALKDLLGDRPEIAHLRIADGRGKPLGRSFRVKLWPTLIFLRDGQPVAQLVRPDAADVERALGEWATV